jgi:SAM-dependent methyltransferase
MSDRNEMEAHSLSDSTQRFTSRVDDYVKYRPRYPAAVLDVLRGRIGLGTDWQVADIGSGTGISAELFLSSGNRVFAVEPNEAMRGAAERLLGANVNFKNINGTAEGTTLANLSIDLIVAAQAFHWFNIDAFRAESLRILKPGSWALLMWNDRQTTGSAFLDDYENLLAEFGTDYKQIQHRNLGPSHMRQYFGGDCELMEIPTAQQFDFTGLRGRLTSSSYVPQESAPKFDAMIAALRALFDRHAVNGKVVMTYQTQLHIGRLT